MQAPWIFSSTFLPCAGEPVDFLVEDRMQPMHGTFGNGMFHSRWADYGADRVQSWRGSEADPSAAHLDMPKASTTEVSIALFKRLTRLLSWRRKVTPIALHHTRSRINTR
jgi:hypothetical protein